MTKNNPLFVDSTKLHGDRIDTQIELSKVLLYDGETLAVMITNHQGESERVEMTSVDESYHARVWLNHQKSVRYRFVIEANGQELFSSQTREARAQYAIIEKWEPLEPGQEPASVDIQPPTPTAPTTRVASIPISVPLRNAASLAESSIGGVASLIDKWGL